MYIYVIHLLQANKIEVMKTFLFLRVLFRTRGVFIYVLRILHLQVKEQKTKQDIH